jgi:hypothetical protein
MKNLSLIFTLLMLTVCYLAICITSNIPTNIMLVGFAGLVSVGCLVTATYHILKGNRLSKADKLFFILTAFILCLLTSYSIYFLDLSFMAINPIEVLLTAANFSNIVVNIIAYYAAYTWWRGNQYLTFHYIERDLAGDRILLKICFKMKRKDWNAQSLTNYVSFSYFNGGHIPPTVRQYIIETTLPKVKKIRLA